MAEYQKNYVVTISYDRESLAKGAEQVKLALEHAIANQGLARQVRMVLAGNLWHG